ncbi:alkaline phosphatase family protein [Paenibacillus doosanensis]|uniref:alkaline phosphatase family protein n=1 Tax=Paenibacillus doosanensis TaxID=1229154 RepID=UPI00218006CB|nr:alkaline phosphatase family protein [Paenibacillus doosanensis]MCS7464828.1 alkaline phosphatase family protein [Paenibacillus doosanensis]
MNQVESKEIRRAIIIGWDGAGSFVEQAETPVLDRWMARGGATLGAQTVFPTISAECWGSLLHGVTPEKHGLNNDKAAVEKYPGDSPYPSLFRVAHEAYPERKLAAFTCWKPIMEGIIEEGIGVHKVSMPDPELAQAVADYIRSNPDVYILFVQFDLPDCAGHQYGYGEPDYLRAISETDRMTGVIMQAVEDAGMLEDSLIVMTTDHGGGGVNPKGHGTDHPLDKTVFWTCSGPGIAAGSAVPEGLGLIDTSAVVCRALGLPIPGQWEARVPEGLFGEA